MMMIIYCYKKDVDDYWHDYYYEIKSAGVLFFLY
jgi:hypothetical protein